MRTALFEAKKGLANNEVPIGAVVAVGGEVVAAAFNQPISTVDPTAHAEIVALRAAARRIGNYRLTGATLCVTVEPCAMCVGAMIHARIGMLVYGAPEPKTGAVRSTMHLVDDPSWNHRLAVVEGVLADECREVVQEFFRGKRREGRELEGREQRAEGREQRAEGREQRAEGRGQRGEGSGESEGG